MKRENIISLFKEKNFRATPQRIAVYEYVYENRNHPDVLAVYENVKKKYPAFSKIQPIMPFVAKFNFNGDKVDYQIIAFNSKNWKVLNDVIT